MAARPAVKKAASKGNSGKAAAKKPQAKKAAAPTKKAQPAPAKKAQAKGGSVAKATAKGGAAKAQAAEKAVKKSRAATKPKSPAMSYTQSEFLDNIMGFCGLTKKSEARVLVEDISTFIKDSLKKGYKLPLMGLGKMYVRKTKPRMGRNPSTGDIIHIGAKKRIRFTPAKSLKDAVL